MNVIMKAMLWWGNTINSSMGYEIFEEKPVAACVCSNCHQINDKARNIALQELNEGLLNSILCQGCYCPTAAK